MLPYFCLVLCLIFESYANVQTVQQAEDIVNTKYGPVQGLVFSGFRRFQGVPFATPPLGDLRWKNPIPPSPWYDVLNCTNFTIACAQKARGLDVPWNKSEDCLYLEVFTPRKGKYSTPAAVMLFFHGGDFKEGGESFEIYNGSYMASTTNTIVVVPNYRLGVFGFLYTGKTDPNVGIADQRMALRWIQENIPAFGGDPNKVTIFGQSAGAESVMIHMAAPDADTAKFFHRAIVESGPALSFRTPSQALELGYAFAYEIGCLPDDLSCMQKKNESSVLTAADNTVEIPLSISEAVMKFAPVMTSTPDLPMEPLDAFEKGKIVKVPFMIGSNSEDGKLFGYAISNNKPLPEYEYIAIVYGIFQDSSANTVLDMYPAVWGGDNRNVTSYMINDYLFLCFSRYASRLAEKNGIPVYYYQFAHVPPVCPWPPSQQYCCNSVCHGDEMPYLFFDSGNPYPWNFTGVDASLAVSMANYWSSFAMYGDPNKYNTGGAVTWPQYSASTDLSIILNWPLTVVSGLKKDKCDKWDTVGFHH